MVFRVKNHHRDKSTSDRGDQRSTMCGKTTSHRGNQRKSMSGKYSSNTLQNPCIKDMIFDQIVPPKKALTLASFST